MNLTLRELIGRKSCVVHLDGRRLDVRALSVSWDEASGTEVTLVLRGVTVNAEASGPDVDDGAPTQQAIFSAVCANCGGLFRNGDGHRCEADP